MQFIDLAAQQIRIRKQIEENIQRVLDHGQYIMGPEIKQLEELLALAFDLGEAKFVVGRMG